jgi:O-antigen/teichoic acid export membrane protein
MAAPSSPRPTPADLPAGGSTAAVDSAATPPDAPPADAAAGLRKRAASSTVWTAGGYGLSQVLRLGGNVVLADLLFEEAFGVMLLVQLLLQGLTMFSDVGIGPSVVRSGRGDEPVFLNSAWTMQVLRGVALVLVAFVAAPFYADFYDNPDIVPFLWVASLSALFQGFNSTNLFLAERHLALKRKVLCEVLSQSLAIATMVAWAWIDPTIWALVAGGVVQAVSLMILSHLLLPGERNRFAWERPAIAEIWGFGRWIFVSTAVTFLAMQIDRMMLGKLLDEGPLGVFSIALGIATIPQIVGGHLTNSIQYPLLSSIERGSPEELCDRFRSQRVTLLLAAGFGLLGIALFSPVFFALLYDPEYQDAGWIAPLVMVPTWFFLLQLTADRALLAKGESQPLTVSNFWAFLGKFAGGWFGYQAGGFVGLILGTTAGTLLGHGLIVVHLRRHGLRLLDQDLRATLGVLAIGGLGILAQREFTAGLEGAAWMGAQAGIAALAVAPVLGLLVHRIKTRGVTG